MSYINDPREMAIRTESGVTLEADNREEPMWHWGAAILDLCGLPVSEYMKAPTFNVNGSVPSSSGETGGGGGDDNNDANKENVNIYVSLINPDGEVVSSDRPSTMLLSASEPMVYGATEGTSNEWTVRWEWTGEFIGSVKVAVKLTFGTEIQIVSALLTDNALKSHEEKVNLGEDTQVTEIENYGVGSSSAEDSSITETTYKEYVESNNTEYTYKISTNVSIIFLTYKMILNGTTVYSNSSMRFGDEIPTYSGNTDKVGYIFTGWFTQDGEEFDATTMPSCSVTVYGKYEAKTCNVSFYIDNEEVRSITVNYGAKIPSTKVPSTTKIGYTFSGWDTDITLPVTDDIDISGTFTANLYTITWNLSGDTSNTTDYYYGDTIEYPDFVKEGYDIIGWSNSAVTMPAKNVTMTAKYKIHTWVLSYVKVIDSDDVLISSAKTSYGTKIVAKALPSEVGYTYSDWDNYVSGMTMPDNDLQMSTIRTVNIYKIAYYVDSVYLDDIEYDYKENVTLRDKYEKVGYTVSDWSGEPLVMPAKNVSAYCTTVINKYQITFVDENNTVISTIIADYGTPISSIIPTTEGYTYIVDEGQVETIPAENKTITLTTEVNSHNVTIEIDDNGTPQTINVDADYGTTIEEILEPYQKIGYDMIIEGYDGDTMPDNDIEVSVSYSPKEYDIFVDGTDTVSIHFGENISDILGTPYVEEGKRFTGWEIVNGTTRTPIDENTVVDENLLNLLENGTFTVESTTEDITTAVTVKVGDNTVSDEPLAYGTNIKDYIDGLNVEDKEGYTTVWTVNNQPLTDDMTVKDTELEVKATYVVNMYTLTFKNEGAIISSSTIAYGTVIVYPTMPSYVVDEVEYKFVWEGTNLNGTTMPANNLTIVGKYIEKPDNNTIYYGAVLNSLVDNISDNTTIIENMSSVEGLPSGGEFVFNLHLDADYANNYALNQDEEIEDDEFAEYLNTIAETPLILTPESINIENKSALLSGVQTINLTNKGTIALDGDTYTVWTFEFSQEYGGITVKGFYAKSEGENIKIKIAE